MVDDLLKRVGLFEHRSTQIGQLSGGQRRRASLVNELISNPNLLFLDEVTSGLDEQTDREMMQLFRGLAEDGKTVVCITHSLANIRESAGLIVFLTTRGQLAFVGTPDEAIDFFQIEQLSDAYAKLQDVRAARDIVERFHASDLYRKYVTARVSGSIQSPPQTDRPKRTFEAGLQTLRHQFPVLCKRAFYTTLADRRSVIGLLMQVVTVAIVVYLVFGDIPKAAAEAPTQVEANLREATRICNVLFVVAVSCFWFGCNNSVKEIVRERAIYTRELQVNLDPTAYFLAKFALQLSIALVQSVALLGLITFLCNVRGDSGTISDQLLYVGFGAAAGVALGLFISTLARTESFALTLVPLVLIPQIILSDVFVKLEGFSSVLGGMFITNFWTYGSLRNTLPQDLNPFLESHLTPARDAFWGCSVAGMQVLVLCCAAILILHVRDRVLATSTKSFRDVLEDLPWIGTRLSGLELPRVKRLLASP